MKPYTDDTLELAPRKTRGELLILKDKAEFHKLLTTTIEVNIFTVSAAFIGGVSVYLLSLMPWETDDAKTAIRTGDQWYYKWTYTVLWLVGIVGYCMYFPDKIRLV